MLKVDKVSVQAGGKALLDDLTLHFAPGELVIVVGPNGAGKTTLLRCLDGELMPARGRVELAGRELHRWPRRELARVRAVLPQQSTLDFPFSVRDVVLMGRIPHSSSDAEDRAIATRALEMCDCAGLEGRDYPSLSGGEKQRVQTARVLAQICGPHSAAGRFLLLDEPASALDLRHQYGLLNLLKNLSRADRIGVICTLHNLNLVAQFADRAVVIDRGMLVADGAPMEVFTEETISHVFNLDVAVHPHPDDAAVPLLLPRLADTGPARAGYSVTTQPR